MSYYDDYEIPPLPDPPSYQDDLSQQDVHQQAQQEAQHETLSVQDRESGQTPDLALDQSVDQSFLETYEPDQFTSRLTYLPRDEQDHVVGNDNEWTQVRTNPTDEHIQNVISGWNDDRFDGLDNLPPPTDDVTQDLSQLIYDTQAAEIDVHALQSPQNDLLPEHIQEPEHSHGPEHNLLPAHENHITTVQGALQAAERIADLEREETRMIVEQAERIADLEQEEAERMIVEQAERIRIADIRGEEAERMAVEQTERSAERLSSQGLPLTPQALVIPPTGATLGVASGPTDLAGFQGEVIVDLQAGRPDSLRAEVGQRPGSLGVGIEAGDWMLGYQGIHPIFGQDHAMARMLAQNAPRWPATTVHSTPRSEMAELTPEQLDPQTHLFPHEGDVVMLRGSSGQPEAFFPPIADQVMGNTTIRRLVPTDQVDVTGLQPSTHPQLHGRVDRMYWAPTIRIASCLRLDACRHGAGNQQHAAGWRLRGV